MPNKNAVEKCQAKSIDNDSCILENNQVENGNDTECINIKPKKQFLKKGTGLARYGLNIKEVKKKRGKPKFYKPVISVPPNIKVPRKCLNQVEPYPKLELGNYYS